MGRGRTRPWRRDLCRRKNYFSCRHRRPDSRSWTTSARTQSAGLDEPSPLLAALNNLRHRQNALVAYNDPVGSWTGRLLVASSEAGRGKSELHRAVCRITSGRAGSSPFDGKCHREYTPRASTGAGKGEKVRKERTAAAVMQRAGETTHG